MKPTGEGSVEGACPLVLLGQYDSPFVRGVAVALHRYGLPFGREVRSVFADFEAVLAVNPLGKVPALRLGEGTWLFESRAIIEYLESTAPPDRRLTPDDPAGRLAMLRLEAVAIGLAEKGYERGIERSRRAPGTQDPAMIARFERQIASALVWLESHVSTPFAGGDRLSRADLAITCALTYLAAKLPGLWETQAHPRLDALRQCCDALPAFAATPYSAAEAAATGWHPEP